MRGINALFINFPTLDNYPLTKSMMKTLQFPSRFFIGLLFLLQTSTIFGQEPSERIVRINGIIGPENWIEIKRKELIIEGFRENIKVKSDVVNYFDIDSETVKYTPIDSIVSFACYSDIGDCVERHLQIDNQKVYRKRVAIRVADKKNAQDVVTEIKALILALQFK
jgi:hypothetical protein